VKALTWTRDVLLVALLALLVFCLGSVALHLPGWLRGIDNAQNLVQRAAGSVAEAADTSNLVSTQTLDTVGSATRLIDHGTKTIDSLNAVIKGLSGTVTRLNAAADQATATLKTTDGTIADLKPTLDALPPLVNSMQKVADDTNATVNGPEIKASLANLAAGSADAAGAAKQANGTLTDVHVITTHYRKEIEAPVSKAKQALKWLETFSAAIAAKVL